MADSTGLPPISRGQSPLRVIFDAFLTPGARSEAVIRRAANWHASAKVRYRVFRGNSALWFDHFANGHSATVVSRDAFANARPAAAAMAHISAERLGRFAMATIAARVEEAAVGQAIPRVVVSRR